MYAEKYIHKGDKLYIEGRIRYRSVDDRKGQRSYITEIFGENLEWLASPRKEGNKSGEKTEDGSAGSAENSQLPF